MMDGYRWITMGKHMRDKFFHTKAAYLERARVRRHRRVLYYLGR